MKARGVLRNGVAVLSALVIFTWVVITGAQAATVYWEPATTNVTVGENFSINVGITLDAGEDVGGFDLDVLYDNTIMEFASYALTENLGSLAAYEAEDWSNGVTSPGVVNIASVSYLDDLSFQPDDFTLFTVSFIAVAPGTSGLELNPDYISDAAGDALTFQIAQPGSVNVSPVPVPASLVLLGSGLLGLVTVSRRARG